MRFEKEIIIRHDRGIHTRVAAMVVQKYHEVQQRYGAELTFCCKGRDPFLPNSLMLLVALKIAGGECLTIEGRGELAKEAVTEMAAFLESDFQLADESSINEMDRLLQDNAFTAEQIFNSMANGLIVTDEADVITVFNPAAEKFLDVTAQEAVGRKVHEILPNSRLNIINSCGEAEIGCRMEIGKSVTITNRTPILIDGKVKGAMAIFEDISALESVSWELQEIKELKERLQLILESVHDGICVLNKEGIITYVNMAYQQVMQQSGKEILGRAVTELSPEGARCRVLATGKPVLGHISRKANGLTLVADVNPIMVDGEMTGVVSVVRDISEVERLMEKYHTASARVDYLEQELRRTRQSGKGFEKFVGRCGKVSDLLAIAAKAAAGNATVLISGESGTGKELVAEGIHYASNRAQGPFVRVNCGAIPGALLESELFGHEKGAFTGAVRRKMGKFELADQGTIFLDEIGELEKNLQVKLLRVLQKKEFERLGGEVTLKGNIRIIAATNRNLEEMVARGEFREDLYYRLNVIPILLPPLRERQEDIPLLVEHFLFKMAEETGQAVKRIGRDAMADFLRYPWPGNVRELENVLERIITLHDAALIVRSHLPSYLASAEGQEAKIENNQEDDVVLRWEEYERQIIRKALNQGGSFNAAGKILGLTHKTVAAKARKYGLEKKYD
ncbi:sigma 54-interacting transcriptional regulator [Azotosporobacter soli]|uniref:sigma 54-interacting transcriptional regulator n=1 Tax=Azotosporobacter soli TaxID=3055040 RepID=UPI0031FEDCFF